MSNRTYTFEESFPDFNHRQKLLLNAFDFVQLDGVRYRVIRDEKGTFLLRKVTGNDE